MADIYMNYGDHPGQMTMELLRQAKIADRIRRSDKVCLKPNLVVSRPAEDGATTHPEIVEGVICYLRQNGIENIVIAEGSWVGESTCRAFERCGYTAFCKKYGVELVDTKSDKAVRRKAVGMELEVCKRVVEADYLINIPVLKGHCQTDMTCCLKNLKGCIPDSEKRRYHTMGLHKPIAALNAVLRPSLHIVDSICGDLNFEEGGNPVDSNRILLGFDAVQMDSYCAGLLGYRPEEIGYLRYAKEYGVGVFFDNATDIVELNADNKPATSLLRSGAARRLAARIQEESACSACYAALLYALERTGGYAGEKLRIGQGFRGKTCTGLGVGNCASGCERYVQGCPPKAVDIVEFLRSL